MTVTETEVEAPAPAPSIRQMRHKCGWCNTGHHELCPGVFANGGHGLVSCPCLDSHPNSDPRCRRCGSRELVDPASWLCVDQSDCGAVVAARLAADPVLAAIRASSDRAIEQYARPVRGGASSAATAARAPRARTPTNAGGGTCLCCGEKTGGGRFRPGHDSRLLSQLAAEPKPLERVAWMRENGCSEALISKFEKRLKG